MIWLRLLIAVIALTISSDLSAWAQPQMQVNSPEGFYDCNGIANGANERDPVNDCCFRSQMNFCGRCRDNRNECQRLSAVWCGTNADLKDSRCGCGLPGLVQVCGVCGYSMRGCESQRGCGNIDTVCGRCGPMQGCESVRGCGNIDTVCDSCTGTMGGCGRCSGCRSCDVSRCQDPGTGVNPAYQCSGSDRLGHGVRAVRIDHISPQRGSKHLYSTNPDAEPPLKPGSGFDHSRTNYICNDGTMVPG